jgi:hypothetical protein
MRAQGVLVLTYALRSARGENDEKIRAVRRLEEELADDEQQYRDRVYRLGGRLANIADVSQLDY